MSNCETSRRRGINLVYLLKSTKGTVHGRLDARPKVFVERHKRKI